MSATKQTREEWTAKTFDLGGPIYNMIIVRFTPDIWGLRKTKKEFWCKPKLNPIQETMRLDRVTMTLMHQEGNNYYFMDSVGFLSRSDLEGFGYHLLKTE